MSMNVFRLSGDMTHLVSILVLMLKIRAMRSCAGMLIAKAKICIIFAKKSPITNTNLTRSHVALLISK